MIAAGHFGAKALLAKSEDEIHRFLDHVYGPQFWRHYETDSTDRSIDIYGVVPSREASDALLRVAGFGIVRQHTHDYAEFRRCNCEWAWLADAQIEVA